MHLSSLSMGSLSVMLAVWTTLVPLFLSGRPAEAAKRQEKPGHIVHVTPSTYPLEAIQAGVRGEVLVELTFDDDGEVVRFDTLSGPEELRFAGLQSALRGSYPGMVARSLQVIVDYSESPPAVLIERGEPLLGLPNTGLVMAGSLEKIEISGLPQPLQTTRVSRLQLLEGRIMSPHLITEVFQVLDDALDVGDAIQILSRSGTGNSVLELVVAGERPTSYATLYVPAVRVDNQEQAPKLVKRVDPKFPARAVEYQLQGVARMDVWITPDGKVAWIGPMSAHPLFVSPAVEAVSQWVYEPIDHNVVTRVKVEFRPGKD